MPSLGLRINQNFQRTTNSYPSYITLINVLLHVMTGLHTRVIWVEVNDCLSASVMKKKMMRVAALRGLLSAGDLALDPLLPLNCFRGLASKDEQLAAERTARLSLAIDTKTLLIRFHFTLYYLFHRYRQYSHHSKLTVRNMLTLRHRKSD